jgi:hypothetical protein
MEINIFSKIHPVEIAWGVLKTPDTRQADQYSGNAAIRIRSFAALRMTLPEKNGRRSVHSFKFLEAR